MIRRLLVVLMWLAIVPLIQAHVYAQRERFITVEGPNLQGKLTRSLELARAGTSRQRFWTAYAFDLRPGVAVDVEGKGLPGGVEGNIDAVINTDDRTITFFHGAKVTVGSNIETRNIAIFMLHESDNNSVSRIEMRNLNRQSEYGGYPVYWLGHASDAESLAILKNLAQSGDWSALAESGTVAIALHGDAQVAPLLKKLFETSSSEVARKIAAFWIGQSSGENSFLADIVRDERETVWVRKEAAFSIGAGKDASAVSTLKGLYPAITNREIKKQIIYAASINGDKSAAADFIARVAENDPDLELRDEAKFRLGR